MDKDIHMEFTKCPCCGSEDRFFEQIGNTLKERGLARDEWNFHLDVKQGVVVDPTKEIAIPIGSEVPGYGIITDVCMECGCVYAIDLTRNDVKKQVAPQQLIPPNRAQRRRTGREGGPPASPFSVS